MNHCFPARFDLCTDVEYFIGQYRWRLKLAVYPLYSPYVSFAVFTTRGEPGTSRYKKETGGKNGTVITKKYTARDNGTLNTHGDLKIRVFGLYEWVFVCVILKLVGFLPD